MALPTIDSIPRLFRAGLRPAAALALIAGLASAPAIGHHSAYADTAQTGTLPATVSADVLPTVQINGVVWAQVTVGNTVYATGEFTKARPAGVAAGGAGEVTRSNLLAYDITTGVLNTSFNHSLNAQGLAIAVSPDKSRIYVAGDFTTVDGVAHNRIAAFNTATGALVSAFAPNLNGSAKAVTASNTTAYVGGSFSAASGNSRPYLAAFAASNGALQTWAPSVDSTVTAIVLSGAGNRVIIGGRFANLNGATRYGLGGVDPTTGASTQWDADIPIQISGTGSDFTSLSADATQVYGTAYAFGAGGNFEGRVAIDPLTGSVVWMNSCHGDSYDAFPIGQVLYSAGHEHDCSDLGAFSQDNAAVFSSTHHFSMAETTYATGMLRAPLIAGQYANFDGKPDSTQLDWYPTYKAGTYTGQSQAAWSVTGNSNYVAVGGEFPTVNGTAQAGLVRFAISSLATNKSGPVSDSSLTPVAVSQTNGTARVAWKATWDQDNTLLGYKLYRDSSTTPIYTTTFSSTFYNRPGMGYLDTGLTAGSSHTYKVVVTDPFGNALTSSTSAAVTIGSATRTGYPATVLADAPSNFWPLAETSGTKAYDQAGYADLTLGTSTTKGAAGPISDTTAVNFAGGETVVQNQGAPPSIFTNSLATTSAVSAPTNSAFSVEAWIKTTSTAGGGIINDAMYPTGDSSSMDRVVYLDTAGKLYFGVQNNVQYQAISTAGSFNDGNWHHIVATLNGTAATLYVDGSAKATGTMTDNSNFKGYWRVGGDALAAAGFGPPGVPVTPTPIWPNGPANGYLAGAIANAAVYSTALSAARVSAHYQAATGTVGTTNTPPTAAFSSSTSGLTATFNGAGSSDPDGTIANYSWTFGDGATATGVNPSHAYATAGTYMVGLADTDNKSATGSVNHSVTVSAPTTSPTLAADSFNRTVASGFGTAATGGAWTTTGTKTYVSVAPGAGKVRIADAGGTAGAYLGSVLSSSTEVSATVALDKLPSTSYDTVYLVGRRTDTNAEYRARVRITSAGAVTVAATKLDGSATEVAIGSAVTISGLTYTPGTALTIKIDVTGVGQASIKAKAWVGATEPSAWSVSGTDTATTAGLRGAGSVGMRAYLSSGVTNVPLTWTLSSFGAATVA